MRPFGWFVIALALLSGGCVTPCATGVCNSKGPTWIPPSPRYSASECNSTPCQTNSGCITCKPPPYLTFAKYWPSLDNWATNHTAKHCARNILWRQQWQTMSLMSGDYKDGFEQAFVDIAQGGDGQVPAVPPPKYWNTYYRSEAGQCRANKWFDGYRAGAATGNIQLHAMKRVASSDDWQCPDRRQMAGAERQCSPNGQSGAGQFGAGQAGACQSGFMGQPGYGPQMGMPGAQPLMPMPPYSNPYAGIDPTMSGYGPPPGYGPPGYGPSGPPSGYPGGFAPQEPMQGPPSGYGPPNLGPPNSGPPPSNLPQPGYSAPTSGSPSNGSSASGLPSPGYSSDSGANPPSTLPSEKPVY